MSGLADPGSYVLRASGEVTSRPFEVGHDVYTDAINKGIAYFARQRCGDSKSGHNAPCHLDDGRRSDDGRRHDVAGGWHDACDLRKWVTATIYGMTGLARTLDLMGPQRVDGKAVVAELCWGNAYFLKMQEPAGYLMNYCGGDDGNRYSDNVVGSRDDRVIHVEPCELPAQFHFIAAQAALARLTRDEDPEYARRCEAAARRCLDWCTTKRFPGAATSLAAALLASVELHRLTNDDAFASLVEQYAKKLLALQVGPGAPGGRAVHGFFLRAPDQPRPSREVMHGNLPLLALCSILERFPKHRDAAEWRDGLLNHVEYLQTMSAKSAFGTIPFGLYTDKDPGGDRRLGEYWYRWFMQDHDEQHADSDWWVGINAHLASNGVGLSQAARLLRRPQLAALAQRQLDWILGVNPFDASTVTAVGHNQPPLFVTSEYRPATPPIPGGVMNGIGGDGRDEPTLAPGSYNTCEYWTPMVAYTMWLMADLQSR